MNIFPIRFTDNYRSDYSVKQIIIESGKIDKYDIWKIHVYLLNNVKFLQLMQQSSWLYRAAGMEI